MVLSCGICLAWHDGFCRLELVGADRICHDPIGYNGNRKRLDVATVAALTAIEVEAGATLSFANTANRCVLSATLSGDGAVNTGDGSPVTFAGDNRSFTGAMRFTNSKIVVTSRYGLGSATDANGAQRYVYSDGSYHATARPNAEGLRFRGEGLTNDVGICWYGNRADDARTHFTDNILTDPLVLNGPIKMNKSGNVDWVKIGNWTFSGGLGEIAGTPCYGVAGGCKAYIRENPVVQKTSSASYRLFLLNANSELHLCVGGGAWNNGNLIYGPGKLVCDAENVLPSPICALGQKSYRNATIDLNGYDQSIGRLTNPSRTDWYSSNHYWSPAPGETDYVCITSAAPATLTMTSDTSTTNFAGRFSGFASLSKTGSAPFFTFVNQYSDTKGTLSVSRGAVQFLWGAGWGGDISISGNGKVIFAEQCQQNKFSSGAVSISGSAKLAVSNDVVFMCSSLSVGGTEMPEGEYGSATLSAYIEGAGRVIVKKRKTYANTYTWTGGGTGWSDSTNWGGEGVPGAGDKAVIPSGMVAAVLDADVSRVETLSGIEIADGGKLDFKNASVAVTVSADISGEGAIRSSAAAGITLNGDNFFHMGSMEFTNTPVYVTSRTGLGNPSRQVVHFGTGTGSGPYYPLRFRGNGLTNDVPIACSGQRGDTARYYTDTLADPWVQNGYLDYIRSGDTPAIYFGDYVFGGGLRNTTGSLQFFVPQGRTCTIKDTPLSLRRSTNWSHFQAERNATFRFEVAGNEWTDAFSLNGNGTFLCCLPGVLDATHALCMARATEVTVLDLNGNDQTCKHIRNSRAPKFSNTVLYIPTRGSIGHGWVTSATDATLTVTSSVDDPVAFRFSGRAGLNHEGTGTNTIVNQFSDTKGTLSVSAGAVKFDWGAGWGGDIAVSGNGKVIFAESCPSNKTSTATAEVTLADSAKLVVSNGARYCCAKLTMGNTTITSGVATAAKYPGWIEGAGFVHVGRVGFAISFR